MIETKRLRLRNWREADFAALAGLCADPRVMRYFPAPLNEAESRELFAHIQEHFDKHGYGPFAVELKSSGTWIGFVGLIEVGSDLPFAPATEITWRLHPDHWQHGYATEAAQAVAKYGFDKLGRTELVAYTTATNLPSQRVMQRLGMQHDPQEDFNHPRLASDHPLRRHFLYRLKQRREGDALHVQ